jgi:hypothetical protein
LFQGKLALVATVSGLFASRKRQLEINTPVLNQTVINTRDSRIVYPGFTNHFGAPPEKPKEEQLRYENGG